MLQLSIKPSAVLIIKLLPLSAVQPISLESAALFGSSFEVEAC